MSISSFSKTELRFEIRKIYSLYLQTITFVDMVSGWEIGNIFL